MRSTCFEVWRLSALSTPAYVSLLSSLLSILMFAFPVMVHYNMHFALACLCFFNPKVLEQHDLFLLLLVRKVVHSLSESFKITLSISVNESVFSRTDTCVLCHRGKIHLRI